jgi:hypothetical protein
LSAGVLRGEFDVLHDDRIRFYPKPFTRIGAAKSTFVVGAPDGYLQQNAVGLTGRTDYVAFVMHRVSLRVVVVKYQTE